MLTLSLILIAIAISLLLILGGWLLSEVLMPTFPISPESLKILIEKQEATRRKQLILGLLVVILCVLSVICL